MIPGFEANYRLWAFILDPNYESADLHVVVLGCLEPYRHKVWEDSRRQLTAESGTQLKTAG